MKTILLIGFAFLSFVSCKKDHCVSCTVQQNVTKDIIESRAVCDKDSDYVQGFADGVKEKYAESDTITVVCGFTEN